MKKLHKYILKEFLIYFILSNVAFISLSVFVVGLMDISKQDLDGIGLSQFLLNVFKGVPLLLELTLPFTVLLATILTFTTFSKTSEIIAMKAGGISHLKILSPVVFIGVLICSFAYFNQSYITHWMDADIYGDFKQGLTSKSYWKLHDGNLVFYRDVSIRNKTVLQSRVFKFDDNKNLISHTFYSKLKKKDHWQIKKSYHHRFSNFMDGYQEQSNIQIPNQELPPIFEKEIRNPKYTPMEILWQKLLLDKKNGLNTKPLKKIMFRKLSDLTSIFVMMFLAFPLSLFSPRQANIGRSILTSLVLGFVFWLTDQIFSSSQMFETFPTWLSAFGANILFFFGALFLFFRIRD